MKLVSPNFSFLADHDRALVRIAARAEQYGLRDPVACLSRLRSLAEMLAREAAIYAGVEDEGMSQFDRLQALADDGILPGEVAQLFHSIRKAGNDAVHHHEGTESSALHHLKIAREAAVWFHRTFDLTAADFHPGPFVPPPEEKTGDEELQEELERLRSRLAAVEEKATSLRALTDDERARREEAEAEAQKLYGNLAAAEELLEEAEEEHAQFEARLELLRTEQQEAPATERRQYFERSAEAGRRVELDEAETRLLIDEQLHSAGWQANTVGLRYSKGARPQKGVNQAIAEWPTQSGPADYVLFAGLTPVAIVEAKKYGEDVVGRVGQAERYARDFRIAGEAERPVGAPWPSDGAYDDYQLPFVFASNGRPYLQQIKTKSGVWFRDVRRPEHRRRALAGFYSPEGLTKLLEQDLVEAEKQLEEQPVDIPGLRNYQITAINKVEEAILKGATEALLAMATGTGKTLTALGLLYRLVKFGRFRRILFLVDRTTLGEQAEGNFEEVRMEGTYAFADVYDVKMLEDLEPDSDTRVQIATVQGMVRRVLHLDEDEAPLPVDQYDCIIIDECHRGYTLDRELSATELTFRDQDEYISKYRRVIEHFDAVRIGLTATPALHTIDIFGEPVYEYSYRQAVVDGYLVDHEPPFGIVTQRAEEGLHWAVGDELKRLDPRTHTVDLIHTPDEVDVDIDDFNSMVVTENFNRAVIGRLVQEIDPYLPGKTLVFCVTDDHADMVVELFKEAFEDRYGETRDDMVKKITGAADKPRELIRHYRNEEQPKVAVTVDLLTTGVDVPAITNIVFLRRVKSRILYEQMLGRATRLYPNLYGPGEDKEAFRIFDAVMLYDALQDYSDMKPVVRQPSITFEQLTRELLEVADGEAQRTIVEQFQAKLQRKRGVLVDRADLVERRTGYAPEELLEYVRAEGMDAVLSLLEDDPQLPAFLDGLEREETGYQIISDHTDQVRTTHTGYGPGNERPEDYLNGFRRWVETNANEVDALRVVMQRPRELTREDLKELKLVLDRAGYTEIQLRRAWNEARNQDIAAGIIGFVRSQALGSPLVPYDERVERALRRLLAEHDWTGAQRQWLERIARQIKENTVVDREALDKPPFANLGGYSRIDKVFDGHLTDVIGEMHEAIWQEEQAA